jgi:hypothetical protein
MNARQVHVAAGTRKIIEFDVTYSQDWSVVAKRGTDVLASEVSSAKFMLKTDPSVADGSASLTQTLGSGITAADGTLTVTMSATDTKDLSGSYYGTLRIYFAGSVVSDWMDTEYDNTPYITVVATQGAVEAVS